MAAQLARLVPDPRADGALLAAFVRDRDEGAFAELVRRHGPTVWGACRRTLPDPADAEDAFQATFLVLLRRGPPEGCLAAWLYRVAVLTARNQRRKIVRRRAAVGTLPIDVPARPEPPPADVDDWLLRLPERERVAVVLCHMHGLTQREAADRLGVPEGTLSARLSRGLAKLRRRGPLCGLAGALPAGVAGATISVAAVGRSARPGVNFLVSEVIRMFWVARLVTAGMAVASIGGLGIGLGVTLRADPAAVAAADPPSGNGAARQLRELDGQRQKLDAQERALAEQRQSLDAKAAELRAKFPPELTGAAFEFAVDRKDPNGPIRLDERDEKGRLLTRTYFPTFRLDDISSLHHPLQRARLAGGPAVIRITSDTVPWDGYGASIAAACHDCGYFPKGGYGKAAQAVMFAGPIEGKPGK